MSDSDQILRMMRLSLEAIDPEIRYKANQTLSLFARGCVTALQANRVDTSAMVREAVDGFLKELADMASSLPNVG